MSLLEADPIRECPRCGREYRSYPGLSRLDNKTEICSQCEQDEAMEDRPYGRGLTPKSQWPVDRRSRQRFPNRI